MCHGEEHRNIVNFPSEKKAFSLKKQSPQKNVPSITKNPGIHKDMDPVLGDDTKCVYWYGDVTKDDQQAAIKMVKPGDASESRIKMVELEDASESRIFPIECSDVKGDASEESRM